MRPQAEASALSFNDVLAAELAAIAAARAGVSGITLPVGQTGAGVQSRAADLGLMGLAFSGGGIRSATFNLGVLQALAERGVLARCDYLSTVSGGGYIGAWYSAWVQQSGSTEVHAALAASAQRRATADQSAPIDFLRRFSNYLTPRIGVLSADFWTAIATHVRNTFLNQTILVPLLMLALTVPWVLTIAARLIDASWLQAWALPLGSGLLLVPAVVSGLNFAASHGAGTAPWEREGFIAVAVSMLLPVAYLLALWLPHADVRAGVTGSASTAAVWSAWGAALYAGLVALCGVTMQLHRVARRVRAVAHPGYALALSAWSLAAGAAGGGMMYGLHLLASGPAIAAHPLVLTGLGTIAVLIALSFTVALHIGLMSRKFPEAVREWLGRAGAWLFIAGLVWIGLYFVAFITPAVLLGIPLLLSGAGGLAWAGSTAAGVLLGRSEATGVPGQQSLRELIARLAPYVFLAGLLGLVATALYLLLLEPPATRSVSALLLERASILDRLHSEAKVVMVVDPAALGMIAAACAAVIALMGWRVDVNLFSIHGFYRNRIARCYLGARRDRERRPQPFTGFDADDDLPLDALSSGASGPQRPLHLFNAALNLTRANNLAWQERKAASFVMTPLHCGYDLDGRGTAQSYLPTVDHGGAHGLPLSTAIAISGAAASPNMGYHSALPVAFLMTLFNVRLGWWMPNTRKPKAWRTAEPGYSVRYILKELFAATDEDAAFVYLSDGGHFDNMGVYELVRRRCRFIIVCDAEADPDYEFAGIASAIRKCRVDFNVEIDLDVDQIRAATGGRECRAHAVLGTIRYGAGPDATGYVLYLKASLVAGEVLPADIRNYVLAHAQFPHESTADQWFDESQFESYRALGHHIAKQALSAGPSYAMNAQERAHVAGIWDRWLGLALPA